MIASVQFPSRPNSPPQSIYRNGQKRVHHHSETCPKLEIADSTRLLFRAPVIRRKRFVVTKRVERRKPEIAVAMKKDELAGDVGSTSRSLVCNASLSTSIVVAMGYGPKMPCAPIANSSGIPLIYAMPVSASRGHGLDLLLCPPLCIEDACLQARATRSYKKGETEKLCLALEENLTKTRNATTAP